MLIVGCGRWGSIFTNKLEIRHSVLGTESEINSLNYNKFRLSTITTDFDSFVNVSIDEIYKHQTVILVLPPSVRIEVLSKLKSYSGKIYIEKPAATSIGDLNLLSELKLNIYVMFKYRSTPLFKTLLDNFIPTYKSQISLSRPIFRPGVNGWRLNQNPIIEELIHFVDFAEQLHNSKLSTISSTRFEDTIRLDLLFQNNTSSMIDMVFWKKNDTRKSVIVDGHIFGLWEYTKGIRTHSLTLSGKYIDIQQNNMTVFAKCLNHCCKLKDTTELHRKILELL